eukprot:TRINITY_DN22858_c0_g1_i1.p1 TRINITY_DN22858_c0_g1~~TRINITY_DN22858_c0_g1_i1.p1  ORF type:complete len:319 (-),score=44.41 TRINITY_DN22858_c0_g1_i1:79-1035(-)
MTLAALVRNQVLRSTAPLARCFINAPLQPYHHRCFSTPSTLCKDLFSVSGLNVVITGGGQGIGRTLAEAFAANGSSLYLLDIRQEDASRCAEELKSTFADCPGAWGFGCDVRDENQIQEAAEAVQNTCAKHGSGGGKIDVLINCAGVTRRLPAEDFPMEDFDRIQATNARGAWCASVHFGSQMLDSSNGGSIINIDSFVTASVLKDVLPYSMSKAAINAMTKGLALEWGPKGVRVNGLAPGLILTPISEKLWGQPHMEKWALDQTPLRRMGKSQDLVGAAIFLASPAARFINGQTIRVDGGLSCGRHWPIDQKSSSTS